MTMKDWVCKGFSINIFDRSMSKMKMTKGLLMTALITGSVMWGGVQTYLLKSCRSTRLIRW